MMDAQILRELETAAQILLASPNLVTGEQRHAAESVFLNFKKTKSPYSLCVQILETSKVDYVLFEVAGLLKDALIREWSFLQESDISSLRQYLFQYVIDRPTLPPFVREKILQVIAIVCKRGSLNMLKGMKQEGANNHDNHRELLLTEIEQLIINGNHSQKLLGCSLLAAILQEYAVTVKSSDIGLSMKTHYEAKNSFEQKDLKRIFQFCCRALGNAASLDSPYSSEALSLIKQLLSISETILTWDFDFSLQYGADNMTAYNVPFTPGPSWKDVLLDPNVINLFFSIYWKIRLTPQLSHHALTCLAQLATIDFFIFNGPETVNYTENYLKEFLKLITSVEILDREALGVSNIIKRTFISWCASSNTFSKLNEVYFEQVTLLTCNFAQGAAKEETMFVEDRLYMEAFDNMMDVWIRVLYESNPIPIENCKQAFQEIFNVYLKCHLSPPEGTRGQGRDLEQEELDESDETDREKFKNQLQTIGGFGQNVPEHCLPLLARLLEARTKILSNQMDKLFQQGTTISDLSALVFLFEDLHWLLLISGNVVFVDFSDRTPQIPLKLMNYSIAQSSTTSIVTTLKVFGSPDKNLNDIEEAEQKTDHLIRLIAAVFRLGHLFKRFIEAKLTQFLSPEVVSSMLWFFREWSVSYLLPKESLYSEISMPLLYAFGRDSEGGEWTVNYLLEQIATYLVHFNSEPGVAQDAVKLFISLMDSKEKSACVLKSEYLPTIISIQSRLPKAIKRDVYQGLALAAVACQDEASRNEYWPRILKPLQDRWRAIVCHENFNRIYQEEQTKTEVIEVLDCLTGVVKGARSTNAEVIFQYTNPIFSDLPTLVGVYRNYNQIVELVFEFFCECAKNMISYLPHGTNKKIYESCIQTIQTYAKCNVGRLPLDSDAQDETFNDIYLLLELLTNLLPEDYFDLSNLEALPNSEQNLMPVDVCLYGLTLIMPLMTANLFKYPPLCLQYFKFIVSLSEMYPEKICQLPEGLLKNILTSVELGLTSFGQDIFPLCCEFLNLIATHICKMGAYGEPGKDALRPFLKILIDIALTHLINIDDLSNAGYALFSLICCYQQDYQTLVQALLNAQPPLIAEQLAKAFTGLTSNISLKYEIQQQVQFSKNFDAFIAKTRGFLLIK